MIYEIKDFILVTTAMPGYAQQQKTLAHLLIATVTTHSSSLAVTLKVCTNDVHWK